MMTLGHGLVHSDLVSHRTSCDGKCCGTYHGTRPNEPLVTRPT